MTFRLSGATKNSLIIPHLAQRLTWNLTVFVSPFLKIWIAKPASSSASSETNQCNHVNHSLITPLTWREIFSKSLRYTERSQGKMSGIRKAPGLYSKFCSKPLSTARVTRKLRPFFRQFHQINRAISPYCGTHVYQNGHKTAQIKKNSDALQRKIFISHNLTPHNSTSYNCFKLQAFDASTS